MNNNVTSSIVNLGAQELKNLTAEVAETVATSQFIDHSVKSFGVADLWNIQRHRKTQGLSKRAMFSRRNTIL